MRRIALLLVCAIGAVGVAHAEWLDEDAVKTAAEAFVTRDAIGSKVLGGRTVSSLTPRGRLWIAALEPSGHIVFSGSDLADPIVGFSKNDFLEPDPASPAFAVLESAGSSLAALEAQGGSRHARWTKLLEKPTGRVLLKADNPTSVTIEPFLSAHYNQWQPYNDYVPVYNADVGDSDAYRGRTPCGCVATAAAQMFHHFKWPARIDRTFEYDHGFYSENGSNTYSQRFDGNVPIDWDSLADEYATEIVTNYHDNGYSYGQACLYDLRGRVSEAVRHPLARLFLWCDVMANMYFNPDGSSSNYGTIANNVSDWYTLGEWVDISDKAGQEKIVADLQAGIPLQVSIVGHAVVAHGWAEDGDDKFIYINYGWGGSNDGFYNIDSSTIPLAIKQVYVGHYPRAKPQLDPLPKVCDTSPTISWHFPDCYTNKLTGFTVTARPTASEITTVTDDFSASTGISTHESIYVGEDGDYGYDGNLLYVKPTATGTYTFPESYTLTSASVLKFRLLSFSAFGAEFDIQARFNGGDWETILTPALRTSGGSSSGWGTERVYLGGHGGETCQLRIRNRYNYGGFYPNGRILVDDLELTGVFAPAEAAEYLAAATDRSVKLNSLDPGTAYVFSVTPVMSDALVAGETSVPITISTAGVRETPVPGEETFGNEDLVFSTTDTSGVWSYSGTAWGGSSIRDVWSNSITANLSGTLTEDSILSFSWLSNCFYGNGSYDGISVVFTPSDGGAETIWSTENKNNQTTPRIVAIPLSAYASKKGRFVISYSHSGSNYTSSGYGVTLSNARITNVQMPIVPNPAFETETLVASGLPTIDSVEHTVTNIVEDIFAECSMGGNVFNVRCSSDVKTLEAHVSAVSYFPASAIEVHELGGGNFVVEVDGSGIPDWAERTRAILTLAATDSNGSTAYKDLSLRFSTETASDSYVPAAAPSAPSVDEAKGSIVPSEEVSGYIVTAKGENVLTEDDIEIAQERRDAYKIEIAPGGKSATVTLKPPVAVAVVALPPEDGAVEDPDDSTGVLVVVSQGKISASPEPGPEETVGALPVRTYSGLYYQAAWGDSIKGMNEGPKVLGTGGSMYLGVIKQKGDKGFYRLTVSETEK